MELSEHEQLVLQTVFEAFVASGTWPTVRRVQRLLDRKSHDLDVRETLLRIPEGLATQGYLPPDQEVTLTVAGLHTCQGMASEVLARFAQVIRHAAAQYATVGLDESVRLSAGHNLVDRYSQLDAMRFVGFVDLLLSMVEAAICLGLPRRYRWADCPYVYQAK